MQSSGLKVCSSRAVSTTLCPSFSQKPQIKQKDKKTQSKQALVWQGDAGTGRLGAGNSYDQHVRGANGKTGIHAEADGHCDPRVEILRKNGKKFCI